MLHPALFILSTNDGKGKYKHQYGRLTLGRMFLWDSRFVIAWGH